MRRFLTMIASLCVSVAVFAQASYDRYIGEYSEIAVSEMHRSGVPASITLAQGLLESNAGQSVLAREGNNHFGIKCAGSWTGQSIYYDDDAKGECFRKYSNAKESFKDHSDFLRYSKRYQSLFDLKITDYKGWAYGLKAAGYATDPSYATKLIKIIEDFNLSDFDTGSKKADKTEKTEKKPDSTKPFKPTPRPEPQEEESIPESPNKLQQAHRSSFQFSLSRPVYELNGVPFIYVMEGETLESIANDYSLFKKELMKFNDMDVPMELHPGDVVYLKAKKDKAIKGLEKHVVDSDSETVRDIAQHYAVKVKALKKLNKTVTMDSLHEGVIIKIR